MMVIVSAFPRRSKELLRYMQTISLAATKFRGLAWLSYDEQFRRRAAQNLTLSWDQIDLELWAITFSGLAKPHCPHCSSPHHLQGDCPVAYPSRRPKKSNPYCYDFNRPSGCPRQSRCQYPYICSRCNASSHNFLTCPNGPTATAPNTPAAVTVPLRNDNPVFSSPKDTCQLQYELSHHTDRDFVSSLLNTLRFGARIGYTGPQKSRVSRNLISASQHPEVVSRNISNVIYAADVHVS